MKGTIVEAVKEGESPRRWRALALLGAAELLAMSLWFSASAVTPALREEWQLTELAASWLTMAVQLGFVLGTLTSALLNLPDVLSARRLFTLCAIAAAVANGLFGLAADSFAFGVVMRFLVGFFLAGVYPPGM